MKPEPLNDAMTTLLTKRKQNSALRALTTTPAHSTDFSSNDFLSLTTSPTLKQAYLDELATSPAFRFGSGGSRLLDGNSAYAEQLEKDIAAFHGAEDGLLFNSGFDANAGFFACVPQSGDVVLFDEFIHASVHEGMRLSRAGARISFSHNSVTDLKLKLEELVKRDERVRDGRRNVFVAIEGLYSMDGDLAPVVGIVEVVERLLGSSGLVVVDEAHSNGIYGFQGRGIVSRLGMEKRIFARLHTFGKGLACNGAVMLCSSLTREYLINYARPLIYSTALSFPSLAAIRVVYSLMKQGFTQPLILHLNELISHLYHQLKTLIPYVKHSPCGTQLLQVPHLIPQSPIFALLTPEPRSLAKWCQDAGFMVRPIVPPTVPEGTQRVRVCLHAGNSLEDVRKLVERIKAWLLRMEVSEKETRADDQRIGLFKSML